MKRRELYMEQVVNYFGRDAIITKAPETVHDLSSPATSRARAGLALTLATPHIPL